MTFMMKRSLNPEDLAQIVELKLILDNDCRVSLMKQRMKKHMFVSNRTREPTWLLNSEHRLIKCYIDCGSK
ncbi:16333_t:CDS:1, partial [Dentiscutata heterogama]